MSSLKKLMLSAGLVLHLCAASSQADLQENSCEGTIRIGFKELNILENSNNKNTEEKSILLKKLKEIPVSQSSIPQIICSKPITLPPLPIILLPLMYYNLLQFYKNFINRNKDISEEQRRYRLSWIPYAAGVNMVVISYVAAVAAAAVMEISSWACHLFMTAVQYGWLNLGGCFTIENQGQKFGL